MEVSTPAKFGFAAIVLLAMAIVIIALEKLGLQVEVEPNYHPEKWQYYSDTEIPIPVLDYWKSQAEKGDPQAAYFIGCAYRDGNGAVKDDGVAVEYFTQAAVAGHWRAQNSLGIRYMKGEGVPVDLEQAQKWFELAAEQGYASAKRNLQVVIDRRAEEAFKNAY